MGGSGQIAAVRKARGWTQDQAARRLGVSQAYYSLLESGRRPVPARLAPKLVRALALPSTALPLPAEPRVLTADQATAALAALGYPGFRHHSTGTGLAPRRNLNPAEVLLAALRLPNLDARAVEALPWLVLAFPDMDWAWLARGAKLHDLQNRLGYVVSLARALAERAGDGDETARLREIEHSLDRSRLAREDTLCADAMTQTERRWLRAHRPPEAHHWNLLTDLTPAHLDYAD